MKILIIGGTGQISAALVRRLARTPGREVTVLNRGNRNGILPEGVRTITADIRDEEDVLRKTAGMAFDSVVEFTAFVPEDVERDFRLFTGRTGQYVFTSSASAYQKPSDGRPITERTPLENPYWQYSRDKIACEDALMKRYREDRFPVTIVRPSHTYDERHVPVGVHGRNGSWQVLRRMLDGKPVLIPGDGSSLWTVTSSEDVATGYAGLIGNARAIGEAFQVTGDEALPWDVIHGRIADALGVRLRACHVSSEFLAAAGEPSGYDFAGSLLGDKAVTAVFDNAKLKALVPELRTTVPFAEGVRRSVEYVLGHPEEQIADPDFDAWCDRVIEARAGALSALGAEAL